MSRIYVTEPGLTSGVAAMGASLLTHALRVTGHEVRHVQVIRESERADLQMPLLPDIEPQWTQEEVRRLPAPAAWFVSVLYVRQWIMLPELFRALGLAPFARDRRDGDPLVAFGGQSMIAPEPIAPFADVMALGDGEITGVELARLAVLGRKRAMREASGRPGLYVPLLDDPATVRIRRAEAQTYNPIVLAPAGRGTATIELARGCRSKCAFCPIGWAGGTYREGNRSVITKGLSELAGRRVNLFAPDYSSVVWVEDLEREVARVGCKPAGRDARLDAARRHLQHGQGVRQYSFGIEGLSERLRGAVAKPLTTEQIVETMELLQAHQIPTTVWYVILGLPGESDQDLDEFIGLLDQVRRVYRGKLNITTTHFQSVPHTPLQWVANHYNEGAAIRWGRLREYARQAWMIDKDMVLISGFKGIDLHEHDSWLQREDRTASDYLIRLAGRSSNIADGRWRRLVSADRVHTSLGHIAEDWPPNWAHIDVGMDRGRVRAAWHRYRAAAAC